MKHDQQDSRTAGQQDGFSLLLADSERSRAFVARVDAIGDKYFKEVGPKDLAELRIKSAISKALMLTGRGLIHLGAVMGSIPVVCLGAALYGLHSYVEMETLGHDVMHGTYDKLAPPGSRLTSSRFQLPLAVNERGWMMMHNSHHANTGIVGRDPDVGYSLLRMSSHASWNLSHLASYILFLLLFPLDALLLAWHSTGIYPRSWEKRTGQAMATEMTPTVVAENLWEFARRAFFGIVQNMLFFPLLTGDGFWLAVIGYIIAYVSTGLLLVTTTTTNHHAANSRLTPDADASSSRAFWMAQQIESSSNFKGGFMGRYFASTLAFQIEHHLFPRMPAGKLAAISQEIKQVCAEFGLRHHEANLPLLVLETAWRHFYFSIPPVMSDWVAKRFPRLRPTGCRDSTEIASELG